MERLDVVIAKDTIKTTVTGLSIKHDILDGPVYNDLGEKIGTVDDIIVTPDEYVAFAIIGVGGFLSLGKKDVAIPMQQLEVLDEDLILPGATKEKLKALPEFVYGRDTQDVDDLPH